MFVMACALRRRRRDPLLFVEGAYEPLRAEGVHAAHLLAFSRTSGDQTVIAGVPRLLNHELPEGCRFPIGREVWDDTRVFLPVDVPPASTFRHVFTGSRLQADENASLLARDLFRVAPVALLITDAT
jgi:(1->4)-alpha-D-glucan 1-alpha-D-glucosylmutase